MKSFIAAILLLLIITSGCSALKSIEQIPNLDYRILGVENLKIGNISISNKSKIKDFSIFDMVSLTYSYSKNDLKVSFICNVEITNPGTKSIENSNENGLITGFPYKLFINDQKILNGDIKKPFSIPSKGFTNQLDVEINFNVTDYIKNNSIDELLNLAINLGGKNRKTSNLKLVARPIFDTPFGNFQYPSDITIVDHKLN